MIKKEKFSTIIRSLSGLVNYKGLVVGISDEFNGLFIRTPEKDEFISFADPTANKLDYLENKKVKLDHESISHIVVANQGRSQDLLLVFPSLSKANRTVISAVFPSLEKNLKPIFEQRKWNLPRLFQTLSLKGLGVNIEGHVLDGDTLYLLSRGNQNAQNELIILDQANLWLDHLIKYESDQDFSYSLKRQSVDLGSLDACAIQWTDAIFLNESELLFLATVEKTDNSFDDGQVLASFLGCFNFRSFKMTKIKKILVSKKAEGLCEWNSRYLICIDSDSAQMSNEFYSLPKDFLD